MSHQPLPHERLFLLRLALAGGEMWLADIRPRLERAPRQRLVDAGLVAQDKARPEGGRDRSRLRLTERGWHWLGGHFADPFESRSPAAVTLFLELARRVAALLARQNLSLGEFILQTQPAPAPASTAPTQPSAAGPSLQRSAADDDAARAGQTAPERQTATSDKALSSDKASPGDLEARVRAACLELTGGDVDKRVRLSALRAQLAEVPRAELDAALWQMARAGKIALQRLDAACEINPEDEQAMLETGSGEPRHVLHLRR